MGFNSTVFILNDHLGDIRRNPQRFVDEVYHAILSHGRVPDYIVGQTTVMQTAHADVHRLYMSHGNAMIDLSFPYSAKQELLKDGGDRDRLAFMIDYYRDQMKFAKSILRDCDKQLKMLEAQEKIERCSHGKIKGGRIECLTCARKAKKALAK